MICFKFSLLAVVLLSSISISKQLGVDFGENRFKKFYRAVDNLENIRNSIERESRKCGYEVGDCMFLKLCDEHVHHKHTLSS